MQFDHKEDSYGHRDSDGVAAVTMNSRALHLGNGWPAREPMPEWNQYVIQDARSLTGLLGDEPRVDVTLTSPPYWDLKNYGVENQIGYKQTLDAYLDDLVPKQA